MSSLPERLTEASHWDTKWPSIFDKYQHDLRHAHYVRALKNSRDQSALELAAGSFRDVAALNRMGLRCDGMDFSEEAVHLARARFPALATRLNKMDAFYLPLADDAYDLTYHNGFWGLFDDADIDRLATEQARVTRRTVMATVHNAHNRQFHQYFERTRETDPLFNIRFFYEGEIEAIMRRVCTRVTVIPVGKAKKAHEDTLIRWGLGQRAILRPYFQASGKRLIERSERLLCIGEW